MGAWGTEILQNDIALDTWNEYLDLFEQGFSKDEIQNLILKSHRNEESFYIYDNTSFWLGLAKTQLDMGVVDPLILNMIKKINAEEIDLHDYWTIKPGLLEQRKKHQLKLQDEMEIFFSEENEKVPDIANNLKDSDGVKDYFKNHEKYHLDRKNNLEINLKTEENERLKQNLQYQLYQLQFENLIAAFSSGKNILELKKQFQAVVKSLSEYKSYEFAVAIDFERKNQYIQSLWLISFAIILEIEELKGKNLLKLIGNEQRDILYEFLALKFEERSVYNCRTMHRKPYSFVDEIIDLFSQEEQLNTINAFLPKWYDGMSDTWFFESHKKQDYSFFGYWSFETAALVKKLGITFNNTNNLPNYPVFPTN